MAQATTQLNSSVGAPASGASLAVANKDKSACPNCEGKGDASFAQLLAENTGLSTELVETATDQLDGALLTDPLPTDGTPVEQNTQILSTHLTSDFMRLALAGDPAPKTGEANGSPSLVQGAGSADPGILATDKPGIQPGSLDSPAPSLTSVPTLSAVPLQGLSMPELAQREKGKPSTAPNPAASQGPSIGEMLTPANENPPKNGLTAGLAGPSDPGPGTVTPRTAKGPQDKGAKPEPIMMPPVADNDVNDINAPVVNTSKAPETISAVKAETKLDKPLPDPLAFSSITGMSDKSATAHTSTKSQSMETTAPASPQDAAAATQQDKSAGDSHKSGEKGENSPSLMDRLKPLQESSPRFSPLDTIAADTSKTAGLTGVTPTPLSGAPSITLPPVAGGALNQPLPQVPLNNMAVHIAAQMRAGNQHFTIRLDPPELGRIDIRMEIASDGQTFTHLAVEKPETLDLLRQDSRALERALANAGLDQRNGSLSFSLKEDNQNKQQAANDGDKKSPPKDPDNNEADNYEAMTQRTLNVSSGLDISI